MLRSPGAIRRGRSCRCRPGRRRARAGAATRSAARARRGKADISQALRYTPAPPARTLWGSSLSGCRPDEHETERWLTLPFLGLSWEFSAVQ